MKMYDLEFPALALSMRPRLSIFGEGHTARTDGEVLTYARVSEEAVKQLLESLVNQGAISDWQL